MLFSTFAKHLDLLESTTSRNDITIKLAELLKEASTDEIDKAVYLALGRLGPLYDQADLGVSSKLMIRILTKAFNQDESTISQLVKEVGDVGDVAYQLRIGPDNNSELSLQGAFDELIRISNIAGKGSQELKINDFASLISRSTALSAKYLVRIPLNKLRLGFSDMTILDALSWMMRGDKSLRKQLEIKYNISADIGRIAVAAKKGIDELEKIDLCVGIPIRPAAAERLSGASEIIQKLGQVAVEPKIDGFRLQCHYDKKRGVLAMYSRNLEPMTEMFPEVTTALQGLEIDSIILEGEAVAYNPETEEFLPFQETVQRRRKHDIEEMSKAIPLRVFCFDLLYLNGQSQLDIPYTERRKQLIAIIGNSSGVLRVTEEHIFTEPKELSLFFVQQIEHGLEGIMAKRLDASYSAGARNFNWVKLKREEKAVLSDTIDCVVMGYVKGQGKRTEFGIGAFLVGVYDEDEDVFTTISKVGTGLSDEQWREMKRRADELRHEMKPARYLVPKELEQDVWIAPSMVVEIRADEITRSPLHTTGRADDSMGYALRFPRLMKWREDKSAEQATTVEEIKNLYKQRKSG